MADALDLIARMFAYPTAASIFLNGIDDVFIDVNYYLRGIGRAAKHEITVEKLRSVEEKRIAILVPAWHEANVIQEMLRHNLQTIDYANYDFFVGTYQNDPDTRRKVEEIARRVPNIHNVIVPNNGPTNKADCLNWVYQGLRLAEERTGRRFDVLVMHDAEDLVHPLEMKLFNYLIPEHDFVQTPVFPLELPLHKLVAGTYIDEFTEHHLKDMLVREAIGGLVPSAGVGSGFARDAFEEIALAHSQLPFNTSSLTEDYEVGLKFRLTNKKVYFAVRAIARERVVERGLFRRRKVTLVDDEYIATREYFPNSFRSAVRQRSRWILGITLQAWEQIGWTGPAPVLYCLWRDRKALFTNYINVFSYGLVVYCLARLADGALTGRQWTFDRVFLPGSALWWLVMVNTLIVMWRAVMKYVAVDRVFGAAQAAMSVPRFFVANVINFAATTRAIWQYVDHKLTGKPLRWLKTDHAFPSADVLKTYKKRLGELLIETGGLKPDDLEMALGLQRRTGTKLGEILSLSGAVTSRAVAEAIGEQLDMAVADPDPYAVPLALLGQLPEADAERLGVLPLAKQGPDTVQLAAAVPPTAEARAELERRFHARVMFFFAAEEAIASARRRAYSRLAFGDSDRATGSRLGERLVDGGHVTREALEEALAEQRATGARLGEILIHRGVVSAAVLGHLIAGAEGGFREVGPDEADPEALRKIGYGFCALHALVPLRGAGRQGAVRVAAAEKLHRSVRDRLEAALGRVEICTAPAIDVRVALAVAARRAWPDGIAAGVDGLDGAELQAISRARFPVGLADLAEGARREGRSPIEHLSRLGHASPEEVQRLRAGAYGLALSERDGERHPAGPSLAPFEAVSSEGVEVIERDGGAFVLAAPHPSPRLAREVASLFPDAAIAWCVAPKGPLRPSLGEKEGP